MYILLNLKCFVFQITELVFNYIVKEMRPIVTCEKPSFRCLIQGLTGITDSTALLNYKNISKILQLKYENYISIFTNLIEKQKHI